MGRRHAIEIEELDMNDISDVILNSIPNKLEINIAWGFVIDISPILVRFAGDVMDTEINLHLSSYTPVAADKVLLMSIGSRWIIIGSII